MTKYVWDYPRTFYRLKLHCPRLNIKEITVKSSRIGGELQRNHQVASEFINGTVLFLQRNETQQVETEAFSSLHAPTVVIIQ